MNATELVHRARAAGLELEPRGDKLRVRGPEPLPRHILTALRTQKAEVLAKLVAPGHRYRPLPVDHELASLYGPEGSRREFLGAVELVAEFSGNPWPVATAQEDLRQWWGVQDLRELEPVDWIVSAANADKVRRERHER